MDQNEHYAVPTKAGIGKTPTGIIGFDELTFGGIPTGRTTLVCGRAGSGKTLFAMTFLVKGATVCGENGVFMSFEENCAELAANVASLGYNLAGLVDAGKLNLCHVQVEPGDLNETGDYNLDALFLRLEHAISKVGARRVVLDTLETLFGGLRNTAVLRAELLGCSPG